MWWLPQDKSLLIFESRSDSNWCTPYKGNLIHTTHMIPTPVHVHHSYASCGQSSYVPTFHVVINRVEQGHCSQERWLPTSSPARQLTDPWVPTQFLFPLSHWSSGGKVKHLLMSCYNSLLGTYLQHVISALNTYSWGLTHRSLTDTDGGYKLGGLIFPHHSPCPSQLRVLQFPLMTPSDLRLTSLT
jgi:hypothetical protein